MDLLGSGLPLPKVKLSELNDSVCNRIRPFSIFQCEVYQTVPDNSTLAWHINGIESKPLVVFVNDLSGTGYSPNERTVSEFKLTAATLLMSNKTHYSEPILISTLTVHPNASIINITEPFNVTVTCDIDHTSISPCSVTTTHRDLTGIYVYPVG